MLYITYLYDKPLDHFTKILVERITGIIAEILELPTELQIEFRKLDKNAYGETSLNPRYKNRITINSELDLSEIMYPLIHELIHVHQIHVNKLFVRPNNIYFWNNKRYNVSNNPTYEEYINLPWETDVIEKQKMIYKVILEKTK
jgi:hypothetical protein